jgi:hypothetical protein
MILGFLQRFEEKIVSGEKRQTIRAFSKRTWLPGMMCDCFVNSRRKDMRCIGRWPCVKVDTIQIQGGWETCSGEFYGAIEINGSYLWSDQFEAFARADGFESYSEMMEFFRGRLPFEGIIIHWEYSPVQGKGAAA